MLFSISFNNDFDYKSYDITGNFEKVLHYINITSIESGMSNTDISLGPVTSRARNQSCAEEH